MIYTIGTIPHIKNHIIVALCAMKNDIYLVHNEKTPVATFQTSKRAGMFRSHL